MSNSSCSACGSSLSNGKVMHPILNVPICITCSTEYHSGEFTLDEGNEIYCRWCGAGEGDLLLCDSCPKGFCSRCIERNFGKMELQRIKTMSDRWNCLICSPEPFYDLCKKNGWNVERIKVDSSSRKLKASKGIVYTDISRGREKYELPAVNEVDNAPPPIDFIYINRPVWGGSATFTDDPNDLACCSCTDGCINPEVCDCLRRMNGSAYDSNGILTMDQPVQVYECNSRCACHVAQCRNRLVTHGPHLRLEVFRCDNPNKGWGVRCRTDIQAGTYVADYIGEILVERDGENRGLTASDEYLFNLDYFGRSEAAKRIEDLGLKSMPTLFDRGSGGSGHATGTSIAYMDRSDLSRHLDPELLGLLTSSGAVERALAVGKRLREEPENYLHELEVQFNNGTAAEPAPHTSMSAIAGSGKARKQNTLSVRNQGGGTAGKSTPGNKGGSVFPHRAASFVHNGSERVNSSSSNSSSSSNNSSSSSKQEDTHRCSWAEYQVRTRRRCWEQAHNILTDRQIIETELSDSTYLIDARWCGSVGRFFNHACTPNMQIVSVFCGDTQDVKVPRVAFFASEFIPANSELCYDYGYFPGNVEGKHRDCLCGTPGCRKIMY